MTNIRVIGGDILVVGGAICTNDNCCCPTTTICTLDTSNDLDVFFDGDLIDCDPCGGLCELCECATQFANQTFQLTWDAADLQWEYEYTYGGRTKFVHVKCVSGTLRVIANILQSPSGPAYQDTCFFSQDTATPLPQTASNDWVCSPSCSRDGTVTVGVH